MATTDVRSLFVRYDAAPTPTRAAPPRERDCIDKDSGLVYRETVVSAPRQISLPQLSIQPRLPSARNTPGAPSLQDLAIRTFLAHIDSVSPDMLLDVPWTVGRRLWKHVLEYDLARPSLWVAFAAAYPDEEQFQYFRASEIIPTRSFDEYIEYMASPSFQWLTCLTISKIHLERADVMRIATLQNLLAMDIYTSPPEHSPALGANAAPIDDRVVRDWSRLATEAGSFPRLRIIILRNQPGITAKALEYISAFPSLTLFGVKGCALTDKHEHAATQHGWTIHDLQGLAPNIQNEIDKSHTWDGALTVCVKHSASLLSSINPSTPPDPPILSFRLGHTSNDILYSAPILFFRRQQKQTNSTSFSALATPDNTSLDTHIPQSQELHNTHHHPLPTPAPQPIHPSAPPTPNPTSHTSTGSEDPQTASQSATQPHKKRKIKVSVQRSFGNMLSGFGIDIVQSSSSNSSSTTTNNNNSNKLPEQQQQQPSTPEPLVSTAPPPASQPSMFSDAIAAPPPQLELRFDFDDSLVPAEPEQAQDMDDGEGYEPHENRHQHQHHQQQETGQPVMGAFPSKPGLTKRRQAREGRRCPWRVSVSGAASGGGGSSP